MAKRIVRIGVSPVKIIQRATSRAPPADFLAFARKNPPLPGGVARGPDEVGRWQPVPFGRRTALQRFIFLLTFDGSLAHSSHRATTGGTLPKTDLLQGTLDLLILKILALGPNHGWGISNRIRQISREGLCASQGSLYPALHRLEMRGHITSEMAPSENNRRARIYTLTEAGKQQLETETQTWEQFALSMRRVLRTA
jgi:transcriptional regulator